MALEPEIDLRVLDPSRDPAAWERRVEHVANRALAAYRQRNRALRRGAIALVLASACGLAVWWSAPRHAPPRANADLLDWAVGDVDASDVLALEAGHAR
ncbi:MAG TPA: hypothetical protein VFQ65_02195 [Kofleriaceae bacterium]|nr:hypothetical protein [Kofleriaceae bacterium]